MPDHRTPETAGDKQAARTALAKARELLAAGTNVRDAANFACVDCPEWRPLILAILEGGASAWLVVSTPAQAAALTRRTYGTMARQQCLRRAGRADNPADRAYWEGVAALL